MNRENDRNDYVIDGSNSRASFHFKRSPDGQFAYDISQTFKQMPNQHEHQTSVCFEMRIDEWNWFGGPSQRRQYWPVEKLKFHDYEYVPKHNEQMNVAERYWLNSAGSFIQYKERHPLYITQNGQKLCLVTKHPRLEKYVSRFVIGVGKDAREAHELAIQHYFTDNPWPWIIINVTPKFNEPIWSTGERFGKDVNETSLLQFTDEITKYDFDRGSILIEDGWEECYGTLAFDNRKFSNVRKLMHAFQSKEFTITLLIHPFVNAECTDVYDDGLRNEYVSDQVMSSKV